MTAILFTDENLPTKPAMAAAWVKSLGHESIRASVAAKQPLYRDENVLSVMSETGLEWPDKILPIENLALLNYDLVISFSKESKPVYPALPGNPPVVYWNIPDPPPTDTGLFDLAGCRSLRIKIYQLVNDLLQQGYLNALMQARKNAELVLDNLHEGIIAHDLNRNIFFFNKAAEAITGYSRQEILGRDCHTVFPEGFCGSKCSFCNTDTTPTIQKRPYQLSIKSKTDNTKQLVMSVVPIRNFLEIPVGIVASFRDVTREFELARRLGEIEKFAGIIGRDDSMQELFSTIRDLANSNASVLIQGESGTGKELVAAAIHNEGNRANKLFVPVNCGALPENLLEAELFGHVKGAFTGAIRDKKGRFELADGGTIFLDEIGDISPAMQVKLLRVLQDGTFQRVGGENTVTVDVRIISATHKNLNKEIAAGHFREDLYYRLCVVPLHLPPLRERRNDIPLLARHFLKKFITEENLPEIELSPEAMDQLMVHNWPGNVRELQNVIRFTLVRCRDGIIKPYHLPPNIIKDDSKVITISSNRKRRGKLNLDAVKTALESTEGNRLKAAQNLGVARATLYRFLDKYPGL
jgi:PAS domain S-box-containing protein